MPAPSRLAPLRVAGVPEHVNLPLRNAIHAGALAGVHATWRDEPAGTGALAAALDAGTLDIATMLTEGAVAAIARGGRFRIVSWWLASALVWGIHTSGRNAAVDLRELHRPRFAISRLGSGSHLMAYVLAAQLEIELGSFVVVHGLEGARQALANGEADAFLWERAMTSPLVETGEFARIGELPTAWPSFVFAASNAAIGVRRHDLHLLIRAAQNEAQRFRARRGAATTISEQLQLPLQEAVAWLRTARWSDTMVIDAIELQPVQRALIEAGALTSRVPEESLLQRIDLL